MSAASDLIERMERETGQRMTNTKSLKVNGEEYWGTCIYSPYEDGYYIEVFKPNEVGTFQTSTHGLEASAWDEAKAVVAGLAR